MLDNNNPPGEATSNEAAANVYRLAQVNRLIRLWQENRGVDRKGSFDLSLITDAQGKIEPEAVDFGVIDRR